jgi:hypothetical protein
MPELVIHRVVIPAQAGIQCLKGACRGRFPRMPFCRYELIDSSAAQPGHVKAEADGRFQDAIDETTQADLG